MAEASTISSDFKLSNIWGWLSRRAEWYNSLSPSQKILMSGAIAAVMIGGGALGGTAGLALSLSAVSLRAAVGVVAGTAFYLKFGGNVDAPLSQKLLAGLGGGIIAALGSRGAVNFAEHMYDQWMHGGFSMAAYGAELVSPTDARLGLPSIHGFDALTPSTFDSKVADLAHEAQKADELYARLSRLYPAQDPDLIRLREASAYYHSMHDQLAADRTDVMRLDHMRHQGLTAAEQHKFNIQEYNLRSKIAGIHTSGGMTLADSDANKIAQNYNDAVGFLHTAKPGTVLFTDAKTGERFWYPLSGGEHPLHPGVKLQPLVHFGGASAGLPLSTSEILYEFQKNLNERLTVYGVGTPIHGANSTVAVTEGWNSGAGHGWTVHHESPGHVDGRCVDIAGNDTSPRGIAKWLAIGERTHGIDLHWEIKSLSPAELLKLKHSIALELVKYGYPIGDENTPGTAAWIADHHVRVIPWATGAHFHIETEGPPIYAPGYEPGTQFARSN
jgi:hypothetical protein